MRYAVTVPYEHSGANETLFETETDALPRVGEHLEYEDDEHTYTLLVERVDWVFGTLAEVEGYDELYAKPFDVILRCRRA